MLLLNYKKKNQQNNNCNKMHITYKWSIISQTPKSKNLLLWDAHMILVLLKSFSYNQTTLIMKNTSYIWSNKFSI